MATPSPWIAIIISIAVPVTAAFVAGFIAIFIQMNALRPRLSVAIEASEKVDRYSFVIRNSGAGACRILKLTVRPTPHRLRVLNRHPTHRPTCIPPPSSAPDAPAAAAALPPEDSAEQITPRGSVNISRPEHVSVPADALSVRQMEQLPGVAGARLAPGLQNQQHVSSTQGSGYDCEIVVIDASQPSAAPATHALLSASGLNDAKGVEPLQAGAMDNFGLQHGPATVSGNGRSNPVPHSHTHPSINPILHRDANPLHQPHPHLHTHSHLHSSPFSHPHPALSPVPHLLSHPPVGPVPHPEALAHPPIAPAPHPLDCNHAITMEAQCEIDAWAEGTVGELPWFRAGARLCPPSWRGTLLQHAPYPVRMLLLTRQEGVVTAARLGLPDIVEEADAMAQPEALSIAEPFTAPTMPAALSTAATAASRASSRAAAREAAAAEDGMVDIINGSNAINHIKKPTIIIPPNSAYVLVSYAIARQPKQAPSRDGVQQAVGTSGGPSRSNGADLTDGAGEMSEEEIKKEWAAVCEYMRGWFQELYLEVVYMPSVFRWFYGLMWRLCGGCCGPCRVPVRRKIYAQ